VITHSAPADNILQILPLSDEYQMKKQKVDCENFLLCQLEHVTSPTEGLSYLKLAQKYNLSRLRENSVSLVSTFPLEALEELSEYSDLDAAILVTVLKVCQSCLFVLMCGGIVFHMRIDQG